MAQKILLLNPPGSKNYIRDFYCPQVAKGNYLWPPGDLLLQSGILGEAYPVQVFDAIAEKTSSPKAFSRIVKFNPKVIFFLTGSISWKEDQTFLQSLHSRLHPILIGSGDILQLQGSELLSKTPFLDGILLDLLSDSINQFLKNPGKEIPNLIYRKNGDIISGPRIRKTEPFRIPIAKYELFPIDYYSLSFWGRGGRWGTTLASYGCPYSCRFCTVPEMGFRFREIDNLLDELRYLQALQVKNIFFRDSSLTNNHEYTRILLARMIQENFRFDWICHSRPDTLDLNLLRAMKDSGCSLIMLGIESGDPELRKKYKTPMSDAEIISVFNICRDLGIKTLAHFIIGLPGENRDTLQRTAALALKINCDFASFNLFNPRSQPNFLNHGTPSRQFIRAKNNLVRKFYLRPSYLLSRLLKSKSPREVYYQIVQGLRTLMVTRRI